MARDMQAATSTAAGAQVVYPGWIVRLDITGDPVLVWTGLGALSFYAPFTRTNLLLQSVAMAGTPWTSSGLASITAAGNDASGQPAFKVVPNTTSTTSHYRQQIIPFSDFADNEVIVCSATFKAAEYSFGRMFFVGKDGTARGCTVNLTTGAVTDLSSGVTAGSINLGGGEWRFWIVTTVGAGSSTSVFRLYALGSTSSTTFAGDGTSGVLMSAPMVERLSQFASASLGPSDYIASGAARGTVSEPGQTGDDQLNGQTFEGIGNIGEISAVVDAKAGSQAVRMKLPGADLSDDVLKQIVADQRKWQFKPSWLWVALFDEAGVIQGQPVRVKTGRLDNLEVKLDGEVGEISAVIESHQAYASTILATRYSEQREIDATDTSQDYIHDLANKSPHIGGQDGQSGGGLISRLGSRVVQRV